MNFGREAFKIKVTNTGSIVHNMSEFVSASFSGI